MVAVSVAQRSALNLGETSITGCLPIVVIQTVLATLVALPIALIFAVAFVRPQVRRIDRVARVSRAFASGDFDARVHDSRADEVVQLGQQFDHKADALQQNFAALRKLAQRNAELAQQVEQSAIFNERIILSPDLHDSIAPNLFSLSVSARALSDIIENDGQ